jgi:hypothetical protein
VVRGSGQVNLDTIRPSTTKAIVHAREDRNGFAGIWAVQAQAICARR